MKPPYIKETIPILKDESISIDEKIDYIESFILKAESEKIKLKKEHDNIESYGPEQPNEFELEHYGTTGKLNAKEYKKRQWQSKLRELKRNIQNKENAISSLELKLKKYQKIKRDNEGNQNKKEPKDILAKKIANKIIENAKRYKNFHHPFEVIYYVMRHRLDQPEKARTKLVKDLRKRDDCPQVLKDRPHNKYKPEQTWIEKIDEESF